MKKHVALFALSAAALLGLGACGEAASPVDGGSSESSQTPVVDNSVKLTVDAPEGIDVTVENEPTDDKWYPGDEVVFAVVPTENYPANKRISKVLVNGHEAMTKDDAENFFFTMPKGGATIKIEDKEICDAKVFEVSDIDQDAIPTLAEDKHDDVEAVTAFTKSISDILIESDKVQGDYLMDASFSIENSPVGREFYNSFGVDESFNPGEGRIYALENNKMKLELSAVNGYDNNTYKYVVDSGYYNDSLFYKHKVKMEVSTSSYYDYRGKASADEIYLYDVVSDDTESASFNSKTMIKKSSADSLATGFGIGSVFANKIYSYASGAGLIKTSSDALVNQIKEVNTTVADDNKSYTMEIVSYDLSNLSGKQFHQYINTFTVDGDGFVSELSCVDNKFTDDAYWDSENECLTDNAVVSSVSHSSFEMTRGFKHNAEDVEITNISDYAMKDYDVQITAQNGWAGKVRLSTADLAEGEALTFEVGTEIQSFYYLDYSDSNTAIICPTFAGVADDEGYLEAKTGYSSTTYTVAKVGETTLKFDNHFGDIKEIPVKFINPEPYKIEASFDKSVVLAGETITLTASVSPAAATQGCTVTLAENDPTESTLTDNGDGTWSIATTKAGTSSVTITSTAKPSVSTTLQFSVAGPATLDGVKALLPTVTFATSSADKSKFASDTINMNFNEDGTGTVVAYYGSRTYGNSSFTWTIDETTLEITITQASPVDGTTITKVTPVNSASFKMTSNRGEVDFYACERVADLSKGPWVTVA